MFDWLVYGVAIIISFDVPRKETIVKKYKLYIFCPQWDLRIYLLLLLNVAYETDYTIATKANSKNQVSPNYCKKTMYTS